MYGKGCTNAKQCSDNEDLMCKKLKDSGFHDVTCKTACCSGDNCNTGPGIKASGQVIIMTVVHNVHIRFSVQMKDTYTGNESIKLGC